LNNLSAPCHLRVDAGPDTGRRFTVGPDGARIGRSSGNDIVLDDPALSRYHCRVLFKPDDSFWINDLGSTNDTMLNGKPVAEAPLHVGDYIEIGETRLTIIHDRPATAPAPGPPRRRTGAGADRGSRSAPAGVDLGLGPAIPGAVPDSRPRSPAASRLIWTALVVAIVAVAVAALYSAVQQPAARPVSLQPAASDDRLELAYEKEEADTNNIFRYSLLLRDGSLSIRIDDLGSGRHVTREKKLTPETMAPLARDIRQAGFFDLLDEYVGVMPEVWVLRDLTVTIGPRAKRVRVLNRLEPENFRAAREKIEEFARNELGLAALALPPEQLVELARDAHLQGRKYMDEREVRYDNLSRSIAAFTECLWYLETIEPKPAFYPEAVAGQEEARRALQSRYDDLMFRADRAINLRDWNGAAEQLRIIIEMIPDRSDDRHQTARKKLLHAERYTGR
jgi:hypothetical protein